MPTPFHLGLFLQGSSAQAWGEPWTGHIGTTWMQPKLFMDVAQALERACFDYILLEDSSYVGESYAQSREIYLHHAIGVPRQDPSVVASLMTAVTSRIGIVPTFATFAYPPYLLARADGLAGPGVRRAGGLEHGHRQLRLRRAQLRAGRAARPRPALRHGGRIHGPGGQALGFVGAGGAGGGHRDRRSGGSHQGASTGLQGALVLLPRPAQLRAMRAGSPGDRAGGRLATGAAVRLPSCGHDRGEREGGGGDARLPDRRAGPAGAAGAGRRTRSRFCSWWPRSLPKRRRTRRS